MKDNPTEKVVLIGGGGHAKSCYEILLNSVTTKVIGYTDKYPSLEHSRLSITYLGIDESAKTLISQVKFLNAIGHLGEPSLRIKLTELYSSWGAKFLKAVSQNAIVSDYAQIGEGSVIMNHAIVQADTQIGAHCIINNLALIEHDCIIGDQVHVSTGAIINGGVKVGNNSFIGSGAIIRNGIEIGKNVLIGMGAVVTSSVPDYSKVKGNPASLF